MLICHIERMETGEVRDDEVNQAVSEQYRDKCRGMNSFREDSEFDEG